MLENVAYFRPFEVLVDVGTNFTKKCHEKGFTLLTPENLEISEFQ